MLGRVPLKIFFFIFYHLIYVYDLVPKGVHENRTKGVENKVDDTLKLVCVFRMCTMLGNIS